MQFAFGDVTSLAGKDWYPLELHSEASVEVYLRRVVRSIPGIFRTEPMELYVPIKNRDLDEFELFKGPFIYARSDYFLGLVRLRKVWGVEGLTTKGGSRLLKEVIKVGDDYIKQLQLLEVSIMQERLNGFKPGVGVRILDGVYRDFCGKVIGVGERNTYDVWVLLDLGFRKIELQTFTTNIRVIPSDGTDVCWVPDLLGDVESEGIKAEQVE